jgi:hypothetical protein
VTAASDQVFPLSVASSNACWPNQTRLKGSSTVTLCVNEEMVSGQQVVVPSALLEKAWMSTPCFFHQVTKSPLRVGIDGHTVPAAVMIFSDNPEPSRWTNPPTSFGRLLPDCGALLGPRCPQARGHRRRAPEASRPPSPDGEPGEKFHAEYCEGRMLPFTLLPASPTRQRPRAPAGVPLQASAS